MDTLLAQLSAAIPQAESIETLSRPLLQILGTVSGMESTYLTTIDAHRGWQRVEIAENSGNMHIPEGLEVVWSDTLCKRSLEEGRTYTSDVAACWGDSGAARALGIQTYVSAPIMSKNGELLGTLCAASIATKPLPATAESLLKLFSALIGTWLEREQLLNRLHEANTRLSSYALIDSLTGLPNRRAIMDILEHALARAKREGTTVFVGLVDLDGFKHINDTYGHQIGDLFLRETGQRLRTTLREMDMVGRLGGDEFGIVIPGLAGIENPAPENLQSRLSAATIGTFRLHDIELDYPGASVGIVTVDPSAVDAEAAFHLADEQMYRIKRQRRSTLRPN